MSSYQQTDDNVERGMVSPVRSVQEIEVGKPNRSLKYAVAVLVSLVFMFAVSMTQSRASQGASTLMYKGIQAGSSTSISISINTPGYAEPPALSMLQWDTIAEPYKTQHIEITSVTVAGAAIDYSGFDAEWTMCVGTDNEFTFSGVNTTFQVDFTGICSCELALSSTTSSFTASLDFTMAIKYVRREIRTLSDDDRNTWLAALKLIYTLPEAEGQALYGSKYHDADYYSAKHLNGAGVSDCDHWHDGAGLLVHHMAFTLMVEQTLQSINPAISMPYWEYGMDSYLYNPWETSVIFQSDWFGEEPTNGEHVIADGGLWEGVSVGTGSRFGANWSISETGSINPFENAYGHLRSPWNNNPDRRIGRKNQTYGMTQYHSMPTCNTLKACFESDSLADINECTNGATHGPVHILIGGAWHEGDDFNDAEYARAPAKLLFFKVLWRMGWTRCPSTCNDDDDTSCQCAVPQEYIDKYGAYKILESANVIYPLLADLQDATDDDYLALLHAVEDPGRVGDFYSSAAAFDPIFWPLHGAAERLVSLKRLYISLDESAAFNFTWAFASYNKYSAAAYLDGVCDWSGITDPYTDLTLPNCTWGEICYGHGENDILDFSSFVSNETYTNIEFFEFLHPWTDDLPYIYETYDFDYCSQYGQTFDPYETPLPSVVGQGGVPITSGPPNSFNLMTGTASASTGATSMTGQGGQPMGPPQGTATSPVARMAARLQAEGSSLKTHVKARSAARKAEMDNMEKVEIPLELVSGITPYSKLKEYSEQRRKL